MDIELIVLLSFLGAMVIGLWYGLWCSNYNKYSNCETLRIAYTSGNHYLHINGKELPHFTFKQFIHFYNLNPDSWELHTKDDEPIPAKLEEEIYYKNNSYSYGYKKIKCTNYICHPIFFTNVFEYRKFYKWLKKKIKKEDNIKNQKKSNEATKKICELVQKDIDDARKNMEKALNETEVTIINVLKNENIGVFNNESI